MRTEPLQVSFGGYLGAGLWFLPLLVTANSLVIAHRILTTGNPVGSLRAINGASANYAAKYNRGYPPTLEAMGPPRTKWFRKTPAPDEKRAALISEEQASGLIPGHRITYTAGPADRNGMIQTYTVHIDAEAPFGDEAHYFTDQTGVIREEIGKEANANSPPIGG